MEPAFGGDIVRLVRGVMSLRDFLSTMLSNLAIVLSGTPCEKHLTSEIERTTSPQYTAKGGQLTQGAHHGQYVRQRQQ